MPDSHHLISTLVQSHVLEQTYPQRALFLPHGADGPVIDPKLDRVGVAIDLDVDDGIGAVGIAAAGDVGYGLTVPIGALMPSRISPEGGPEYRSG